MRRPGAWAAALTCLAVVSAAHANEPVVAYQVRAGDTLYAVSQRYLESGEGWRELQRLNGVRDPRRLPPGLRLKLPLDRLRGVSQTATVLYALGGVEVEEGSSVREALPGDRLPEGARVRVAPGGFAGLGLSDGSTLHLQGDTQLKLLRLREAGELGVRDQRIGVERGRVDSTVKPLPPGSRFDVRTPRAVTGVRGTQFGVALGADGLTVSTDVIEGHVALMSTEGSAAQPLALKAGTGAVLSATSSSARAVPLLPAPEVESPLSLVERFPQALRLVPVPGALGYRVQVTDSGAPARVLSERTVAEPLVLLPALPDGEHLLRLRAVHDGGVLGRERALPLAVRTTPVAPLLRSPAAGEVLPLGTVRLICTEVPGAEGYLLQVSPDLAFGRDVREQRQDGRCDFQLRIAEQGEYHWRVASLQAMPGAPARRGPFSDAGSVTLLPRPIAPAGLASDGDGRRLFWRGHAGERYRVQLSEAPDFESLLQDLEVPQAEVRLDLPACRPSFVRLSTISAQGLTSPWSAPRRVGLLGGLCTGEGASVGGPAGAGWDTQAR